MVGKLKRGFKGIWVAAEIWLDPKLSFTEKGFIAEIDSLDNDDKGCWAANSHFARFFGLTPKRVSVVINELVQKGYITSHIDKKSGNKRTLKLAADLSLKTGIALSAQRGIAYHRKKGEAITINGDTPIPGNRDKDKDTVLDSIKIKKKPAKILSNDEKKSAKDMLEAFRFLWYTGGVSMTIARRIIYDDKTPPESIFNVIQNGLARQWQSEKAGGKWVLKPGYIVKALQQASKEGKIIKPTKASIKLKAEIEKMKVAKKVV